MNILVDSSIWIDCFKGGSSSALLDCFISENLICTNDLILAEIIPILKAREQAHLIELLCNVANIPLQINWQNIIEYRVICSTNGMHRVGMPDMIILDSIIQNKLSFYTLDKHFSLINNHISFDLI
jgi:predicted nucleic acid-binding protein